jgi:KDO2-lipid IV(A) lauroyltransferase
MAHLIEYLLFQSVGFVLRLFPLSAVRRMGALVGGFVGATLGYRRAITLDNLRNAFPEMDEKALKGLMRSAFQSVGTSLFEFAYFPRLSVEAINDLIKIEDPEFIRDIYARGKGVILLTAHFGNWEMIAQSIPAIAGIPVHVIVKPQANRFVDRKINEWRTKFGNIAVPMESSVREMLKVLREKKAVGIVGDQTAAKESAAVPFFGRDVPTFEGPSMFSLKTGAPLLLGFAVRQADGNYIAQFFEVPSSDLKAYTPANVLTLTKRHVAMTEAVIRKYPDQWMWMHKRWKHVRLQLESNIPTDQA